MFGWGRAVHIIWMREIEYKYLFSLKYSNRSLLWTTREIQGGGGMQDKGLLLYITFSPRVEYRRQPGAVAVVAFSKEWIVLDEGCKS